MNFFRRKQRADEEAEEEHEEEATLLDDADQYQHEEGEEGDHGYGGGGGGGQFYYQRAFDPIFDSILSPGDGEKGQVLKMFQEMRTESTFCDVAFLCQGVLFRAHRIVASAWSRWLRALLCEGPSEEVVSLDVFDPIAFGTVLDYMYGTPINISVENAESLIKVVRRLEMHLLEQSMWIYLMKAIDDTNCKHLHELADRYDCPPLKLSAWRILQEAEGGFGAGHMHALDREGGLKGTGLTGPGEATFLSNLPMELLMDGISNFNEDDGGASVSIFSVFYDYEEAQRRAEEEGEEDDDDDEEEEEEEEEDEGVGEEKTQTHKKKSSKRKANSQAYTHPSDLPFDATATDIVNAWSARLHDVWLQCSAPDGDDFSIDERIHVPGGGGIARPREAGGEWERKESRQYHGGGPSSPSRFAGGRGRLGGLGGSGRGGGRGLGAAGAGGGGEIDWKAELKGFYLAINKPERVAGLDEILYTWKGKEEQMLSQLIMKYKKIIPESLANHLESLQGFLETQSESSFVMRR